MRVRKHKMPVEGLCEYCLRLQGKGQNGDCSFFLISYMKSTDDD